MAPGRRATHGPVQSLANVGPYINYKGALCNTRAMAWSDPAEAVRQQDKA